MTSTKNTNEITKLCFLQTTPCIHTHVHMLLTNADSYLDALWSTIDSQVFFACSQATKARVIAALHITKQHKALQQLLPHCEVVEIVKALSFLDRQRLLRQTERKIGRIEGAANPQVKENATDQPRKKRRKVDILRGKLKELQVQEDARHNHGDDDEFSAEAHESTAVQELVDSASVSGALARKIRQWAKDNLKARPLEFVVLTKTVSAWKKLADLVHFHPDDFALSYFLPFVYGEALPEDSLVHAMQCLVDAKPEEMVPQFKALAAAHSQIYEHFNFLRTQPHLLRVREIAEDLVHKIPLSTAIWYLEELAQSSHDIPAIVGRRLKTEDWSKEHSKVTASFGKLVERVLTFQSKRWNSLAQDLVAVAGMRLSALKETWSEQRKGNIVVLGDASASMTSAIQAATIMATMISVCFGAELSFFNGDFLASPYPRPSTVEQTLQNCRTIRASGCTSLAAALWPYYAQKQKVDRIFLVSDEGENSACHGFNFAELLQQYKKEVHEHVELIIICVDSGERYFRDSLESRGISYKVVTIDGARPDLTKFDALLGQMALGASEAMDEEENEEEFVVVDAC